MPIQRSQTEEVEAPPLRVNDGLIGYLHVDSVKGASADTFISLRLHPHFDKR